MEIGYVIEKYNPWAIINAAGYVRVDDAESDSERCFLENTTGPELLAEACKSKGIRFVTFSSDLVFDGSKESPYLESDTVNPLNVYGQSKAEAEKLALSVNPESLIIRTSAFFGPWDEHNFVHAVIKKLANGDVFHAGGDVIAPTYVPHLVNTTLDLLIDKEYGIWHLSNGDAISWYELAKIVAERAGLDASLIREHQHTLPAFRPAYSVLGTEKGQIMPSLTQALEEYFSQISVHIPADVIN
jgi:dTDP-4-dehydrorhamnose reductase